MTALRVPLISATEYLLREERSEVKHEFVSGHVYMMSGAKPLHNQISVNILSSLSRLLQVSPCIVYNSDQRVRNQPGDTYFYPDCSVACGPQFDVKDPTSLMNPVLVCEVLSPSTQAYDLGDKAERYACFESVRAMLLVSSEEIRVELRERLDPTDTTWTITLKDRLDETISIPSLGIELPLSAIYAKAELPPKIRVIENGRHGEEPPR